MLGDLRRESRHRTVLEKGNMLNALRRYVFKIGLESLQRQSRYMRYMSIKVMDFSNVDNIVEVCGSKNVFRMNNLLSHLSCDRDLQVRRPRKIRVRKSGSSQKCGALDFVTSRHGTELSNQLHGTLALPCDAVLLTCMFTTKVQTTASNWRQEGYNGCFPLFQSVDELELWPS